MNKLFHVALILILLQSPLTTAADSAEADILACCQHRQLRVVSMTSASYDFPPYNWIEQTTGLWRGLNVDILRRISEELGLELLMIDGNFNNSKKYGSALEGLESGDNNLLTAMFKTPHMPDYLYYLAEPIYQLDIKIYTLTEQKFDYHGWQSLEGRRGAATRQFSESITNDIHFSDFERLMLNIRHADTTQQMLELLLSGEVDYIIAPRAIIDAQRHLQKITDRIVGLEPVFTSIPIYFLATEAGDNRALARYLERRLRQMRDSGQLQLLETAFMRDYLRYKRSLEKTDTSAH